MILYQFSRPWAGLVNRDQTGLNWILTQLCVNISLRQTMSSLKKQHLAKLLVTRFIAGHFQKLLAGGSPDSNTVLAQIRI